MKADRGNQTPLPKNRQIAPPGAAGKMATGARAVANIPVIVDTIDRFRAGTELVYIPIDRARSA